MSTFRLNSQRLDDLEHLCSLDQDTRNNIHQAVKNLDHNINPRILLKALEDSSDDRTAKILMQLVLNVASYSRAFAENPDALIDQLREDVSDQEDWMSRNEAHCDELFSFIKKVINCASVNLVAKTLDISSNYGSVLTDLSLTTDMRPVFNAKHDGVVGSIVVSTMYIESLSAGETESKAVIIHLDDLKKLHTEVGRAIDKIEVLKNSMGDCLSNNFYVPGEEQNEN